MLTEQTIDRLAQITNGYLSSTRLSLLQLPQADTELKTLAFLAARIQPAMQLLMQDSSDKILGSIAEHYAYHGDSFKATVNGRSDQTIDLMLLTTTEAESQTVDPFTYGWSN